MPRRLLVCILFPAAVLAAGAAASARADTPPASPASAPADERAFAPFVFLHAGDPELGSPDLEGTARRLNLVVDRANELKVEAVFLAGDVWHDPDRPQQQQALDETLARLRVPVYAVPGNHDHPHMDVFRKRFGRENVVVTRRNCDFVCVDSNDLSPATLEWLEESLTAARNRGRTHTFVILHHPPVQGDKVDRVLARHRVSGVFAGHLHQTGQADRGTYRLYWVSGSAKVRDEHGLRYHLVRVGEDKVEVESLPLETKKGSGTFSVPNAPDKATRP